jgi:hypothetical protein
MKSIDNRLWARNCDPSLASGGESKILKNWEYRGYQNQIATEHCSKS